MTASIICLGVMRLMQAKGYRMDLMHGNSIRAGYLDLDGCTPVDMLPRFSFH